MRAETSPRSSSNPTKRGGSDDGIASGDGYTAEWESEEENQIEGNTEHTTVDEHETVTQLVTLRHPEKDITILRACSPVLDGILRDASPPDDGGNKVLTIDDVCLEGLTIFVDMITASLYAPTNLSRLAEDSAAGFRSQFLAFHTELLMPLIHKYNCQGLLIQLQAAVNAACSGLTENDILDGLIDGLGESIATMLGYDTEDTAQWMTASTMRCFAAYSIDHTKDDYVLQLVRATLYELPPAIIDKLIEKGPSATKDDIVLQLVRATINELPPAIIDNIIEEGQSALESVAPRRKDPLIGKGVTELRGAKRVKKE